MFGDHITALTQRADGVHVDFAVGPSATFDLVVGADGMHSGVRRLAFGDEITYVRHLRYYLAQWNLPNDLGAYPEQPREAGRRAA